jgi:hypothetical protein
MDCSDAGESGGDGTAERCGVGLAEVVADGVGPRDGAGVVVPVPYRAWRSDTFSRSKSPDKEGPGDEVPLDAGEGRGEVEADVAPRGDGVVEVGLPGTDRRDGEGVDRVGGTLNTLEEFCKEG